MNINKSLVVLLLLVIFLPLFNACTTNKKPDPVPVRSFGERAIKIDYKADKELNLYEGKSHTILMCLYQLSDSNIIIPRPPVWLSSTGKRCSTPLSASRRCYPKHFV